MGTREQRLAVLHHLSLGLAHGFRTPLTLIVNALHMVRQSGGDSAASHEGLRLIDAEVIALNGMLDELCDITAPQPAELERCNLATMLRDAHAKADPRARVELILVGFDEDRFIWCECRSFQRMLHHLCENAVRAMKGRGTLRVSFEAGQGSDILEFTDTGPGVPAELAGHLFEPFVSSRRTGLGLGLAYCRSVIERLGGTIEHRQSSEAGAVFRVSLPQV